jgi:hypothetical protein
MPISVLDDFNPYREITSISGQELMHYYFSPAADTDRLIQRFPFMRNELKNGDAIEAELLRRGVLQAPEVPAYTKDGVEIVNARAIYVDKRIGTAAVRGIDTWIDGLVALPEDDDQTHRALSPVEVRVLVGTAMDELGISETLRTIKAEDAAQQPLDLNTILREQLR